MLILLQLRRNLLTRIAVKQLLIQLRIDKLSHSRLPNQYSLLSSPQALLQVRPKSKSRVENQLIRQNLTRQRKLQNPPLQTTQQQIPNQNRLLPLHQLKPPMGHRRCKQLDGFHRLSSPKRRDQSMFQRSLMIHKLISRKKMESSRGIRRKVDALKITKTKTESKIPMIIIRIQVDPKRRRRKKKEKESRSPSRLRQLPQPLHPPSLRIKGR